MITKDTLRAHWPDILAVGLECDPGWHGLIDGLCATLDAHARREGREPPRALQIKEKMGGLRFYTRDGQASTRAVVSFAEAISNRICELCGNQGRTHKIGGYICTRCPACASRDGAVPQDLSFWVKPRIPPMGIDLADLRARRAAALEPNAVLELPPGWLDLADAVLDDICFRREDTGGKVLLRDTPGTKTFLVGGRRSKEKPGLVTAMVREGDGLRIDVDAPDRDTVAVLELAVALAARTDPETGRLAVEGE